LFDGVNAFDIPQAKQVWYEALKVVNILLYYFIELSSKQLVASELSLNLAAQLHPPAETY